MLTQGDEEALAELRTIYGGEPASLSFILSCVRDDRESAALFKRSADRETSAARERHIVAYTNRRELTAIRRTLSHITDPIPIPVVLAVLDDALQGATAIERLCPDPKDDIPF